MKKKIIILAILISTTSFLGFSQNMILEGKLARLGMLNISELYTTSQRDYSFGTARSAAMGGAFTSLGGDLSSININPAGLGMYRSSEFSFSPSIISTLNESKYKGGIESSNNDNSKFGLNNIGFALNLFESDRNLTSLTMGFSYNKLADFNHRSGLGLVNENNFSIGDMFVQQLRGKNPSGLSSTNNDGSSNNGAPFRDPNNEELDWGAILAYQTEAVSPYINDGQNHRYYVELGDNARTNSYLNTINKGYLSEYGISLGMNYSNNFYLGFTLGIMDLYNSIEERYHENYSGNTGMLKELQYNQLLRLSGTGVNFKGGFIYRPIAPLRIGFSIHTPTYYSLVRDYSGKMKTDLGPRYNQSGAITAPAGQVEKSSLIAEYEFNLITPTRINAGISYAFGQYAIISCDYERVWYNNMRVDEESDEWNDYWKSMVKNRHQASNNIRIGAEVKPLPFLSLRAGFAKYNSGADKDRSEEFYPIETETTNLSAGIGFRFERSYIDLAFVNSVAKLSPYNMFLYDGADNNGDHAVIGPGVTNYNASTGAYDIETIKTTRTRNIFTATFGFRF